MVDSDFYAVLGVLPDAEDVVVTASYRALAQRYHPDKWKGEPSEALRRMGQINQAYAVLGDKARRAEYDAARAQSRRAEYTAEEGDDQSQAFASALNELEERWGTARSIYPDLVDFRARLSRISTSLAFAYVTVLLETKAFTRRGEIASHIETVFLERYFGTNQRVLDYARSLIFAGHKAAAKALNRLVNVVGSDVDPHLVISRVEKDFGFQELRERQLNKVMVEQLARTDLAKKLREQQLNKAMVEQLARSVLAAGYYDEAVKLAGALGYTTEEVGGGFFKSPELVVTTPVKEIIRFKNSKAFVRWAQQNLCMVSQPEA